MRQAKAFPTLQTRRKQWIILFGSARGSASQNSTDVTTSKPRTLLIENDVGVAMSVQNQLETEGYKTVVIHAGNEGLAEAQEQDFDLVITDLILPGLSGLDLIARLHEIKPSLPIIFLTAFGATEDAIEAMKLGAYDYLLKPFEMPELLRLAAKAVDSNRCTQVPTMFVPMAARECKSAKAIIVGNSRSMQSLYKEIGRAAGTSRTVLIRGDTGTGKELVARAIHEHSSRINEPFIAVNCAAIPETLLESELFGYERGSFTGANARRIGRFEQARRGTLFLDEIGDLSPSSQVKLLRVLQEKQIQRVGGDEIVPIEARVITATHKNLEMAMKEKQFREDLFYRLSALTVRVPSLSQRLEDIPELIRYFIATSDAIVGVAACSVEESAIDFLENQLWPGNIRELENVVRYALLLAGNYNIRLEHVQEAYLRTSRPATAIQNSLTEYFTDLLSKAAAGQQTDIHATMMDEMERQLFTQAISLARGNQAKAARWLGVTRTTIREKLTRFGLREIKPTELPLLVRNQPSAC